MLSYLRNLLRRNRRKVFISTTIVAAIFATTKYVAYKFREAQKRIEEERFAREQIKLRFQQTQHDCFVVFLSLLPMLKDSVYGNLNVERITGELNARRMEKQLGQEQLSSSYGSASISESASQLGEAFAENRKSKIELWQDLKIISVARFLTTLYSESYLMLLIHLQLNVLSRRSYLESAIKLAEQSKGIEMLNNQDLDEENLAEQAFLSFSWWIINKGTAHLVETIETQVRDVFSSVEPRDVVSFDDFVSLIKKTQSQIETQTLNSAFISKCILPPSEQNFFLLQQTNDFDVLAKFNNNVTNTEKLNHLLSELSTYLNDESVAEIVKSLVHAGADKVLETVGASYQGTERNRLKVASLVGHLTKHSAKLTENLSENETLEKMNFVLSLEELSAKVYSNMED